VKSGKRQAESGKWKGKLQKNYSFAAKEKHKFAIKKFLSKCEKNKLLVLALFYTFSIFNTLLQGTAYGRE